MLTCSFFVLLAPFLAYFPFVIRFKYNQNVWRKRKNWSKSFLRAFQEKQQYLFEETSFMDSMLHIHFSSVSIICLIWEWMRAFVACFGYPFICSFFHTFKSSATIVIQRTEKEWTWMTAVTHRPTCKMVFRLDVYMFYENTTINDFHFILSFFFSSTDWVVLFASGLLLFFRIKSRE